MKNWTRAYWLLVAWFAINFGITISVRFGFHAPFASTVYNQIAIFLILALLIQPIWAWCRFINKFRIPVQVMSHVLGVIVYYLFMGSIYYFFDYYLDNFQTFDEYMEFLTQMLGQDAFQIYYQYFATAFVFYIVDYTERLKEQEKEKRELALKNQEMQLSMLKSQISPHFLFNALNSISMLIGTDKDKARRMISRLSEIFRYALESYEDQQVSLKDELRFTENYLSIQQVRFEDRLTYHQNIDPECMDMKVPSMVLQPIVENSVKHGIAPKDEGGYILISIKKNGRYAHFEVEDDGLGINANNSIKEHGSGVGLSLSDKRLRKMYGEGSKIHVEADKIGFTVRFKIPLHEN